LPEGQYLLRVLEEGKVSFVKSNGKKRGKKKPPFLKTG